MKNSKKRILIAITSSLIVSFIYYETSHFGTTQLPVIKFGIGDGQSVKSVSDFFAALLGVIITSIQFITIPLIVSLIFKKYWYQIYLIGLLIATTFWYSTSIMM